MKKRRVKQTTTTLPAPPIPRKRSHFTRNVIIFLLVVGLIIGMLYVRGAPSIIRPNYWPTTTPSATQGSNGSSDSGVVGMISSSSDNGLIIGSSVLLFCLVMGSAYIFNGWYKDAHGVGIFTERFAYFTRNPERVYKTHTAKLIHFINTTRDKLSKEYYEELKRREKEYLKQRASGNLSRKQYDELRNKFNKDREEFKSEFTENMQKVPGLDERVKELNKVAERIAGKKATLTLHTEEDSSRIHFERNKNP